MFASRMNCSMSTLSTYEDSSKVITFHESESTQSMIKYLSMIMPLMFETWTELKPTDKEHSMNMSILTFENSVMLKLIMDIIMELFYMIEECTDVKQHFFKKYQDKFEKLLLLYFPYSQNDASKKAAEFGGERCIYQNISIAILYLFFSMHNQQRFYKYHDKVFTYVEALIFSWKIRDTEFNFGMNKFIRTLFTKNSRRIFANNLKPIFNALVKRCNVDQSTYDPKFALVCEIIEGNDDTKKDGLYEALVSQMVEVLANKKSIPVHLVKTIKILAKRGNQLLIENLNKNALQIVKNLQSPFEISGALNDGERWKKETLNLIYWISDRNILEILQNHLTEHSYMKDLVLNKISTL
jgi:pre-rRNA-processing protein IPI1